MADTNIKIVSLGKDVICSKKIANEIACVHMSAFPNFFLTTLGIGFLRTYYRCFANHKNGILIVATLEDRVVAFAAAASKSKGFNRSLLISNLFVFSVRIMILLFSNPIAIIHLAKNMTKTSNEVVDNEDYAELYSIGTLKEVQGKGIGSELMECLEKQLKRQGVAKISLTTDYDGNIPTLNFYKKNGYKVMYDFITYPNRKMYRLIKEL